MRGGNPAVDDGQLEGRGATAPAGRRGRADATSAGARGAGSTVVRFGRAKARGASAARAAEAGRGSSPALPAVATALLASGTPIRIRCRAAGSAETAATLPIG